MKTTGIIRRIDDLGRIVIPKEIRRNLKIRNGEMLEILLDSTNIVLSKFSPMADFISFTSQYIDTIYNTIKKNIIVTDRDKIIAISGDLRKKYIEKEISDFLLRYIERRESFVEKYKKELFLTTKDAEECTYVISPIIANSECAGLVIILSIDDDIKTADEQACFIAAQYLGKHIES